MDVKIQQSWKEKLGNEFDKSYFKRLVSFVKEERSKYNIYPKGDKYFRSFDLCPFDDIKVVIIGQDPYHGENQANGLCFSVNDNMPHPPSLKNIFKEIKSDIGKDIPKSGNLDRWAQQGVLLLNATLTVRANSAGSHQNKGWEEFTDAIIKKISIDKQHIVFMLWGSYAQKKGMIIDKSKHYILTSPHPSPLSAYRGFFGNHHFSKANDYLVKNSIEPIDW